MAQIQGGTTYSTGDQVSSTNLNAHVNNAILLPGSIGDQTAAASVNQIDSLTILQAGALKKATIAQIKTATDQDLTGYIKSDGTVPMTADLALFRSTSISGLTAAPVAYIDNAIAAVAAVPTGAIMPFYRNSAPSGWLECNGQSTTGYAALQALIGANVPDLRGEFIRGWDNGRGIDSGRALGSSQAEMIGPHTHAGVPLAMADTDRGTGSSTFNIDATGSTGTNSGTENRPRNMAFMYCIKT